MTDEKPLTPKEVADVAIRLIDRLEAASSDGAPLPATIEVDPRDLAIVVGALLGFIDHEMNRRSDPFVVIP